MRRAGLLRTLLAGTVAVAAVFTAGAGASSSAENRITVVPHVKGELFLVAYRNLHRAGLRVSIPARINLPVSDALFALRIAPGSGSRVRRGSVVALRLGCPHCGGASIGHPVTQPRYRVPEFRGGRVSAAYDWVRGKALVFGVHLGALRAGRARGLFANYRVTRQEPAPGTMLRFATAAGWITPLTIWGKQIDGG